MELPEHALVVVHECDEIDRLGGAAQAQAAHDELVHVNLAGVVHIQQLEEAPGFCHVDSDVLEVVLHVLLLQLPLEGSPSEAPVLVQQSLAVELAHAQYKVVLLILRGTLHCGVHEDTRDDVQHRQDGEGNVQRKEDLERPMHVSQWPGQVLPVDAPGHRLEERQHRRAEGSELLVECGIVARQAAGIPEVVRDKLREAHADHIEHEHEQHNGPCQGLEGVADGAHQLPQLPDEPQDADDPQHPHEANKA
mmetsp:Transcript_79465/g.177708  ORF Transcript_79465/g.177708 Transcript_79465/m.177708 type:complete len:250 (+) Transcript_79465:116-865(+)